MNQHWWSLKRRAFTMFGVCALLLCGCSTSRKLTVLPDSQRAELFRQSDVVVYARVTKVDNLPGKWRLKDTFYQHVQMRRDIEFAILSNVKGDPKQSTLKVSVELQPSIWHHHIVPGSEWLIGYQAGYRNMFIIYEEGQTNGVARSD